jgi:hypothetical protein
MFPKLILTFSLNKTSKFNKGPKNKDLPKEY